MRPTFERTRDPLKLDLLPAVDGLELDYRPQSYSNVRIATLVALSHIALLSGIGFLVTFGLRWASWVTGGHPFILVLYLLIAGYMAIAEFIQQRPLRVSVAWLVFGPLVWSLMIADTRGWHALLWATAIIMIPWFANEVVTHHAWWMHANPQLERDTRLRWRAFWQPQSMWAHFRRLVQPASPPSVDDQIGATEGPEQENYAYGYGAVLAAYLLAVIVLLLTGGTLLGGMLAVFLFAAVMTSYGVYNLRSAGFSIEDGARATFAALVNWLTYNAQSTRAPGVFRSPHGSYVVRWTKACLVFLGASLVILPLTSYFPIVTLATGLQPWLDVAQEPWLFGDRPPPEILNTSVTIPPGYKERLPPGRAEQLVTAVEQVRARRAAQIKALTPLLESREGLIRVSLRAASRGNTFHAASLAVSFLFCYFVPTAFVFVVLFGITGRALAHHQRMLEGDATTPGRYHRPKPVTRWEGCIERLRASEFEVPNGDGTPPVREADHLLLGFNAEKDYPILLDVGILGEHAHITGDTGSGKSAIGIASLVAQLVGRPHTSIVVLDLKGDMALFETTRQAVHAANALLGEKQKRIRFQWFTGGIGRSTYAFNPFQQRHMAHLTVQSRASILLQSLGLDYGEGYGEHFYSSAHHDVLIKALREDSRINSFRKLRKYFLDDLPARARDLNLTKKRLEDAAHLFMVVDTLAGLEAINVTPEGPYPANVPNNQIDVHELLNRPGVAYFYLETSLDESASKNIAKLVLYSLLTAAKHDRLHKQKVFVFIDEFQEVVSLDLQIVLRQARSSGISVILANQTISDLRTPKIDIIPTVQGNTRFRQVFSTGDFLAQRALVEASGETIYELYSVAYTDAQYSEKRKSGGSSTYVSGTSSSQTFSIFETLGPRLRPNDVIAASDRQGQSLVQITRGKGFTQFGGFIFPMTSDYPIDYKEYREREQAKWPPAQPGSFVPTLAGANPTFGLGPAPSPTTGSTGKPAPPAALPAPAEPPVPTKGLEARLIELFEKQEKPND